MGLCNINAPISGEPFSLRITANTGNTTIAKLLIEKGADVNYVNSVDKSTPLHAACMSETGSVEMVKLLLDNGADVKAKIYTGLTSLHFAKNAEIAKLLIENGADVNAGIEQGQTPLDNTYIGDNNKPDVREILIKHGAVRSGDR